MSRVSARAISSAALTPASQASASTEPAGDRSGFVASGLRERISRRGPERALGFPGRWPVEQPGLVGR
jgi:hypothetical protein